MKILIVDRYFYPDLQATSVLLTDIAGALSKTFDIRVLCGPTSDFKNTENKQPGSVHISVIPSTNFNQKSLIGRLFNYASFLFMTPFAILFQPKVNAVMVGTSTFAGGGSGTDSVNGEILSLYV